MKTLLAALTIFVASITVNAEELTPPNPPEKWQNPQCWRNIKPGITPDQASRLLGDPAETDNSARLDVWYYAGKDQSPKDAVLVFRKLPDGQVLQKVMPPNWNTMPSWTDLQAEYKEAMTDYRAAIAEQKRIAAQAAIDQRAAERAERIAQNTTTAQQITTRPRPTVQRNPIPPAAPDKHTQLTSRYFISIGIGMFIIAFIIAGSYGFKLFKT